MKELSIEAIKALPKAEGDFSAVVTIRPGEKFVAAEVVFREDINNKENYRVGGLTQTDERSTSVIFDIPKNIQDGKHLVGDDQIIQAIYFDDRDFEGTVARARSGEIDLRFDRTNNTIIASDFHFRTRGTPGLEIHLGRFNITE